MSRENNFESRWNKYYIDFNEEKIINKLQLAASHKKN